MKNNFFAFLTAILLFALMPVNVFAQSASESYKTGLALMKKQDYEGAIASFNASKAINKSAANVKKCNAQIRKAQRLQRNTKKAPVQIVEKKLTVNVPKLVFSAIPNAMKAVTIEASPDANDWLASVDPKAASWCTLSKSIDGKDLQVSCQPTNLTIPRNAHISVTYGDLQRTIDVKQVGKPVEFGASSRFEKFSKKKGGKVLIDITCTSDTTYENQNNWIIEKSPDWCTAEGTKTSLVLTASPITKKDPDYKSGRTGDVILRSQNEEMIIRIDQK